MSHEHFQWPRTDRRTDLHSDYRADQRIVQFFHRYMYVELIDDGICKFGNFREGFIIAKLRIILRRFVKTKSSRNGEITLSITDIGKSCPSREFKLRKFVF